MTSFVRLTSVINIWKCTTLNTVGCANMRSIAEYRIDWVVYDGEFNYHMDFEVRAGYIYIDIEHKDIYNTLD